MRGDSKMTEKPRDLIKETVGESEAWSMVAKSYDDMIHAFSAFHNYAINTSDANEKDVVLDLACGPGSLTRRIHNKVSKVYSYDFATKMIHIINSYIESEEVTNIFPTVGDGENLIYKDRLFDKVFSMFGLKFFPGRIKGLLETARVLKPGGILILGVWCPMKELEMFNLLFRAINSALPHIEVPEHVSSMDSEDVIRGELTGVGFENVNIEKKSFQTTFNSPEHMFDSFIDGAPPFAAIKKPMEANEWKNIREQCLSFIISELKNEQNVNLPNACFFVKGQKPEDNF
ncbi:MAG: methyltransferase domain-containing protein [Candidatus Latescibacterota bacterium]|nr:methyltransferase domain-containing protein [Candidatus Latescibacterota bacterium]